MINKQCRVVSVSAICYCLLLVLSCPSTAGENKSVLTPAQQFLRSAPQKIQDFTFGKADLKIAQEIARSVRKDKRLPYLLIIAEYYRSIEGRPDKSIATVGEFVFDEKQIAAWQKANADAEKEAIRVYREEIKKWEAAANEAKRNQQPIPDAPSELTGIYADLPSAKEWNITAENVDAAIELARCLILSGKIQEALRVIDKIGGGFHNEARVLAAECGADLFVTMQMYEKAVEFYEYSLKYLELIRKEDIENRDSKGEYRRFYSDEQAWIKQRVEKKLRDARELRDANLYGPDWVAYRAAEKMRRERASYFEAYQQYSDIIAGYPNTVYGEAAKCYRIKTLIALANSGNLDSSQKGIDGYYAQIKNIEDKLAAAVKAKVGKKAMFDLEAQRKELIAYVKKLESTPRGTQAAKQVSIDAESFLKQNEWGLYRGETLYDLGGYYLEREFDVKAGLECYSKAKEWFDKVVEVDSDLAAFDTPDKAAKVAAPPRTMRTTDVWGNSGWAIPKPGDLFNRRTSGWYRDYYRMMCGTKMGFCFFILGEKEQALKEIEIILEVDETERAFHNKGWPSNYGRLRDEFIADRLFATKEDLANFKGKMKTQLMVADYYYEMEQWGEAIIRYREFDRQHGDKLNTIARAYIDLMLGYCAQHEKDYATALTYFGKFETDRSYYNTPSWERALITLAVHYQNRKETHNRTIELWHKVIKKQGNTENGWYSRLNFGTFYYSWKYYDEAEVIYKDILKNCKIDWIRRGATQWMEKLLAEREGND